LDILRSDESDLPEILELQRLAFQENALRYGDPDTPPMGQTLEELTEEARYHVTLKAVIDGKIIGFARGCMDGEACHISKVTVHPDHWNRGIGKRLVAAVEDLFDPTAYELVTGHMDEKNIALYKKLGYEICDVPMEKITPTLFFIHMRKEKRKEKTIQNDKGKHTI